MIEIMGVALFAAFSPLVVFLVKEEVFNPFPKCCPLRRPRHLLGLGLGLKTLIITYYRSQLFNDFQAFGYRCYFPYLHNLTICQPHSPNRSTIDVFSFPLLVFDCFVGFLLLFVKLFSKCSWIIVHLTHIFSKQMSSTLYFSCLKYVGVLFGYFSSSVI